MKLLLWATHFLCVCSFLPNHLPAIQRRAGARDVSVDAAKPKPKKKAPKVKGRGFGAPAEEEPPPPPPLFTDEKFVVSECELPSGDGINTQFMGAFMIEDESVCDDLIAACEADTSKLKPGIVGRAGNPIIDKTSKDSLETSFQPNDKSMEWRRYVTALQAVTMKYTEKYPYCANHVCAWGLSVPTNFQYYPPSGGYKIYHTERQGKREHEGGARHLVFMTYLNDVTDEGGTEFFHQNVTIQPRKGLTLIWPSDWTFMHRGVSSPSQEKRIMTGWFNFG